MARVEHPWECKMMGHEGGDRIFYAAPPSWFDDPARGKKMSYPNKCTACKEWIEAQTDEVRACSCGAAIRITAGRKRSIFKRVGPYEPITECQDCSEGRRQPKGTKKRPDREKRKEEKQPEKKINTFKDLKPGNAGMSRRVVTSVNFYRGKKMTNDKNNQEETWLVHLEHHIPGSEHDWTSPRTQAALGLSGKTSPTSLVGYGASGEELLEQVSLYAASTDTSTVRDYTVDTTKVARVTFTGDESMLELSILALSKTSDDCYVITSYDSLTAADIEQNGWYKSLR